MKVYESLQYGAEFKQIFGLDLRQFLDNDMLLFGEACIDIIKLDEYMLDTYPEYREAYDNNDMSLSDYIEQKFGARANVIIERLLE